MQLNIFKLFYLNFFKFFVHSSLKKEDNYYLFTETTNTNSAKRKKDEAFACWVRHWIVKIIYDCFKIQYSHILLDKQNSMNPN